MDDKIAEILLMLPGLVAGFTIHELAHAWAAYKLGDPTARNDGRLTLNPLKHIDPIGFIMILVVGFGWAKPVMIDARNLRHPIRDGAIISAAGPAANFLAATVLFPAFWAAKAYYPEMPAPWMTYGITALYLAISVNLMLFLFNLIPLPPLDGSHILVSAIPPRYHSQLATFMRIGPMVLLGVILFENFTRVDILPIGKLTNTLFDLMDSAGNIFLGG